jgi:hypothetical protein
MRRGVFGPVRESSLSAEVLIVSLFIGVVIGAGTEIFTPWLGAFLGVNAIVIFGLGLALVEGPTLISAIVMSRRVTRVWVRNALEASAPFVGFFAYIVAYGYSRHPPFSFPFRFP